MVIIDLWKDIGLNSICISKKLGLFLKNPKKDDLYINVKSLVEDDYMNNFEKDRNFRKKLIGYLNDKYYKNEIKKELEVDEVNDDSLGADFYEIDKLSKDELSSIAILELEKLGYKLK